MDSYDWKSDLPDNLWWKFPTSYSRKLCEGCVDHVEKPIYSIIQADFIMDQYGYKFGEKKNL